MARKPIRDAAKVLVPIARKAAENAYCPYSGIHVGAAVLAASGNVYSGCNIENASYGLTICAERVAVQHAVAAGERKLLAVAVFSPDIRAITPCGACRQVLAEFSGRGTLIFLGGGRKRRLAELLPASFALK